jgi:hypothetical protein
MNTHIGKDPMGEVRIAVYYKARYIGCYSSYTIYAGGYNEISCQTPRMMMMMMMITLFKPLEEEYSMVVDKVL